MIEFCLNEVLLVGDTAPVDALIDDEGIFCGLEVAINWQK
jgi:hypothetical protein